MLYVKQKNLDLFILGKNWCLLIQSVDRVVSGDLHEQHGHAGTRTLFLVCTSYLGNTRGSFRVAANPPTCPMWWEPPSVRQRCLHVFRVPLSLLRLEDPDRLTEPCLLLGDGILAKSLLLANIELLGLPGRLLSPGHGSCGRSPPSFSSRSLIQNQKACASAACWAPQPAPGSLRAPCVPPGMEGGPMNQTKPN